MFHFPASAALVYVLVPVITLLDSLVSFPDPLLVFLILIFLMVLVNFPRSSFSSRLIRFVVVFF